MNLPYLTLKEVQGLLKISQPTIHRMIKDGRLPVIRFGRIVRVDPHVLNLPKVNEPQKPQKKIIEEIKKELTMIERLLPDLEKAFRQIPPYGEVGFKVHFVESQPVRIEYSTSMSLKLKPKEPLQPQNSFRK